LKIDRLLGIIVLLIHKQRMKAMELSHYFEVSERTIYRDMETICRAGIPVHSIPGKAGGYELMPRFRLDKKYLTLDDLLSIQWALKSVEQATGFEDIHQLVLKINHLIDTDSMKENNISLHISPSNIQIQLIQPIYTAIQNNEVLNIRYVDHMGNETERSIEPMGIYFKDRFWYTWAYCLFRDELRVFKLTRIVEAHHTGRSFNRRPYVIEDVDAKRGAKKNETVNSERSCFTVHLQFNSRMRARVLDEFRSEEINNHQDGTIHVTKDFYTMEQAISEILSYGKQVRIIHPQALIAKFIKHIEDMKQLYAD
jgi:predicted DNA-binding transcriptional regulator YafY